MSGYDKNKMALIGQGITGHKIWSYSDTGDIGDIQETAGFVANAGEMGMDTGDFVYIRMSSGFTNRVVRGAAVMISQDTGATQGTMGLSVVLGDTS